MRRTKSRFAFLPPPSPFLPGEAGQPLGRGLNEGWQANRSCSRPNHLSQGSALLERTPNTEQVPWDWAGRPFHTTQFPQRFTSWTANKSGWDIGTLGKGRTGCAPNASRRSFAFVDRKHRPGFQYLCHDIAATRGNEDPRLVIDDLDEGAHGP